MSQILSLELRPKTLSEMFGQEKLVSAIRQHVAKRPPRAWMFTGSAGAGKTTIMEIMSVAYQCQHQKLWGDPCATCFARKSDFAIHDINVSDKTGIDELRAVVEMGRYKPTYANGKRVILLDECQKASRAAQDMLLKPTENVPESTVWILGTTEPSKLLPTLRRRFVTYALKPLGITESEKFLEMQAKRVNITKPLGDLFEQCHLMQVSSPALLLQALEKYAAGRCRR